MAIAFLKTENIAWKILSTIDIQMVGTAFSMRSPILDLVFLSKYIIYNN